MKFLNKKGTVLLFAVVAITVISVLGTGIYFMTTTSTFSGLGANDQNRAYQLAVAGRDYALAKNLTAAEGGYFTLTNNGGKFRLAISGDTIASTGIVNENTPYEARRTITVTKTGFGSQGDISFEKDIAAMGIIQPTSAPVGFISKTASALSLGQIGPTYQSQFGAVVYSGNAAQGNCVAGKCEFGSGFNAFFVFQFAAGSTGDGFTFTFFNGDFNDSGSVGGDSGRGELMGYAGDSRIDSAGTSFLDNKGGRGIQPPKVAIEFDPYANFGSADVCASGSRRDGTDSRNHAGYVFWGDNTNSSCTSTVGRNTYDDNRHNNGGVSPPETDPINSRRPTDGADPSYFDAASLWPSASSWLLSNAPTNIYAVRIEVTRITTPISGNYNYTINSWVKQCLVSDITCPTYNDASNYANTKINYNVVVPGDPPTLTRTFPLTPTLHQNFAKLLFGWTTATGSATQNININRFKMNFLK